MDEARTRADAAKKSAKEHPFKAPKVCPGFFPSPYRYETSHSNF